VSSRRSEKGGDPPAELGPLPGGHHGLSREQVAESQRERLLAALAHVVAARGYKGATITEIVKAASVSSKAFYENFESKEECFLAAFDAVMAHLKELVSVAVAPCPDWPQQLIAALRALLDFFEAEPDLARLCLVEPVTATPAIAARFREEVIACIPYLKLGRAESAEAASLPESTEDSLLGGLVVLSSRSILAGDGPLPGLLPDLVEFVLAPYLGPERAKALGREVAVDGSYGS
jgi:AcrR family transcriptional regulator